MIKVLQIMVLIMFGVGITGTAFLFYGPYTEGRDLWIASAMTTMNHKYLATWFFSDKTIAGVMEKNRLIESVEVVDTSKISIPQTTTETVYKESDTVELIDISNGRYKGYLLKISNPASVYVGTTAEMNKQGMKVDEIVKRYNAAAGINGGGFVDEEGHGTGGFPTGIVIENYNIIHNDDAKEHSIIGFDKNNVLILGKFTLDEIENMGIRDAVDFGPFLIVNGKASIEEGNGGWGLAPRAAIGQTENGTVLLLVITAGKSQALEQHLKMFRTSCFNMARIMRQTWMAGLLPHWSLMERYRTILAANMDPDMFQLRL